MTLASQIVYRLLLAIPWILFQGHIEQLVKRIKDIQICHLGTVIFMPLGHFDLLVYYDSGKMSILLSFFKTCGILMSYWVKQLSLQYQIPFLCVHSGENKGLTILVRKYRYIYFIFKHVKLLIYVIWYIKSIWASLRLESLSSILKLFETMTMRSCERIKANNTLKINRYVLIVFYTILCDALTNAYYN